jgi:hypothetical protein
VLAVRGAIVVSTLALAAVATIGPYIYLSATTSIEMPYEHCAASFSLGCGERVC